MSSKGLEIPFEVADQITLASLRDHLPHRDPWVMRKAMWLLKERYNGRI